MFHTNVLLQAIIAFDENTKKLISTDPPTGISISSSGFFMESADKELTVPMDTVMEEVPVLLTNT